MANETEELRLIVTLVDNATPGAQRIRRELNLLNNVSKETSTGVDRLNKSFEGFERESEKASRSARGVVTQFGQLERGIRGLAGSITSLDLRGMSAGVAELATNVGGLGRAFGGAGTLARAAGVAIGGVTATILAGVVAVVGYKKAAFDLAQELKSIGDTARSLGMSAGEFKALTDQAARYGITADQVARSIQNMQDKLLDLHTTGSDLRRKLLREGLDPAWLRQYMAADEATQLRMGREKALEIEESVRRRGYGRGVAAAARRRFEGDVGIGGELTTTMGGPFTRGDPAQIEKVNEAAKNAREMAVAWNDLMIKAEHIRFDLFASGIKGVTENFKQMQDSAEAIERSITSVWQKLQDLPQSDILGGRLPTGAQPGSEQSDLAPIKLFQHEGMNDWPMSQNIEDRRVNASEDQTEQTKLLVDQMRILNENIRPGSSMRTTGSGVGAGGGGGGSPMPSGVQSLLSPPGGSPIGGGGGGGGASIAPPGVGGGSGPMGGGGPPAGTVSGNGEPYLANQRAGFGEQLKDPATRRLMRGILSAENPGAGPAVVESLMNRTAMVNESRARKGLPPLTLRDMIVGHPSIGGGKSFYGPMRTGAVNSHLSRIDRDPAYAAKLDRSIDAAVGGSNTIQMHTDQGSAGDPNYIRGGVGVNINRERFNDWGYPGSAAWRQRQMQAIEESRRRQPDYGGVAVDEGQRRGIGRRSSLYNDLGGAELDRILGREVTAKVNGSAKVDVNVNAPPGTKVDSSGAGILKDITTTRQIQMPVTNELNQSAF